MNILVINAGSSSVKFSLIDAGQGALLAGGVIERIGLEGTSFRFQDGSGREAEREARVESIFEAVRMVLEALVEARTGVIGSVEDIGAIGHRVVHGGETINRPVLVDEEVKAVIQGNIPLAPLHNPPNLMGIEACEALCPGTPQVAIFDTAFHATLPDQAYMYAIPASLYQEHHIRRYGFHGTSHKYVAEEAAGHLQLPLSKLTCITCHLGNGCSMTAVDKGCSVDTSMGLTPLEGLIMGTRCGDIDPSIIAYLLENTAMSQEEVFEMLNKKSGLMGLAGIGSSDLRDIEQACEEGHEQAATAFRAFCYRIRKYIGSYLAVLPGVQCLVFTGGIGENSAAVRETVCAGLEHLGIALDAKRNRGSERGLREVQAPSSRVKVLIIPTDEEREITKQVVAVLKRQG